MNVRQRQDAIVRSLRRHGTSTINSLAEEVGASRRTVLRDIAVLREEGFVIHSEPGRGGGLRLDPHSVQTMARLSVDEVFGLLISVVSMRATANIPFLGLADLALSKIEKSLPPEKIRDLRRFLGCLYIGQLAPQVNISNMGEMDPVLLTAFETAFLRKLHLRFEYRDAKGAETYREVEPQAMLILPPLWYLVAWDPSRDDYRYFRMDRIRKPVAVAEKPFKRRHVPFDEHVSKVRSNSS